MKRVLLILIIFCASLFAQAQGCLFDRNLDWAEFSSVNRAISLNDGSWVLAGSGTGFSNTIIRVGCNGDTLWTRSTQAVWVTDMVFYNSKIYVTGTGNADCLVGAGCAISGCSFNNKAIFSEIFDSSGNAISLFSFDLYGNVIPHDSIIPQNDSSAYISCTQGNCDPYPYQIAVVDTGKVLLSVGDILSIVNPTVSDGWEKLWQKQFKGKINAIQVDLPYLYLSTDSGLIQIDTSGKIIRSNYSYAPFTNSYLSVNGNLYFTAGNLLLHLDSSLNIIDSFNLGQEFIQWRGLTGANNNVAIAAMGINDSVVVAIFDSGLSFKNEFPLSNQCTLPVDLAAFDSVILIVGNDSLNIPDFPAFPSIPNKAGTNTIYYKTYGISGAENSGNAQATFLYTVNDSFVYNRKDYPLYQYVSLLLKNTGADTIRQISITTDLEVLNCVGGTSPKQYFNLNILPGDTFRLDSLVFYYGYPTDPDTLSINFFLTSLNGSRIAQNCAPIGIESVPFIYNSIANPSIPQIKIFPNPTDGIINIQSKPAPNTTFTLSDMNGRVLMEKNLSEPNEQLNISVLASGMYIYVVRNANQLPVTGKVIKQ